MEKIVDRRQSYGTKHGCSEVKDGDTSVTEEEKTDSFEGKVDKIFYVHKHKSRVGLLGTIRGVES